MTSRTPFRPFALALACSTMILTGCSQDDPESLYTQHLERAKAYQEQGQYKAAIIEYRNAVKKSEGKVETIIDYADMLNEMGRFGSALALLEEAQDQSGEAIKLETIESYIGLKKFRSATEMLSSLGTNQSPLYKLYGAKIMAGRGDIEEARGEFERVALSGADSSIVEEAYLGLTTMLAQQGQFDEALASVAKISVDSDSYPESQVIKAGIQITQDDLEGAEATLSDTLSRLPNTDLMQPEKAVVLERLAYVLTRLGRSNEAYIYQKLLSEAFPGANEVQEKYQSALKSFENKELTQAKAGLQSILQDYPNHSRSKQLLGVIAYLEGDTQGASSFLEESVDPEAVDPFTRNIYAATSLKLNDPQKVLEILGPEAAESESAQTLSLYGMAAISSGQGAKGEEALKKAASIAPDNVPVRLALASYYRQLKQEGQKNASGDEQALLNEAYAIAPTNRQVLTDLVSFYLRNEGADAARKFLDRNLSKHPEAYASNLVAGYFSLSAREIQEGLEYFNKALQAKSQAEDHSEALFAKGRSELALQQLAAAEKSFNELVRLQPRNFQAYQGLYLVLSQSGQDKAAEQLEQLAKRNAVLAPYFVLIRSAVAGRDFKTAEKYLQRARLLETDTLQLSQMEQTIKIARAQDSLNKGDYTQARNLVSGLLAGSPDSIQLLSMLADVELRDQKLLEAEKVIGQIKAISDTHPVVQVLLGDLAYAKQNLPQARDIYQRIWTQNPSEPIAEKLFMLLGFLDESSEQLKHLDNWLERFPQSPKPMLFRAIKYQERGQRIKAAELYERLLAITPNNVAALNNLGWIYFEKGDQRSIPTLEKAVQLAPKNSAVLDSLGWVLFKNGRVAEGRKYLKKAKDLSPDNKEIAEHYAEAMKG